MYGPIPGVLWLGADRHPASATLADIPWLERHWVGTGLGVDCDVTWHSTNDNAMTGVFRFHRESTHVFSEYKMIEALIGGL